ncbi:MAG: GNAT superfamily N-acetyltransferase [Paracoccaceae bacterium]
MPANRVLVLLKSSAQCIEFMMKQRVNKKIEKIDPTRLSIRAFGPDAILNRFDCGNKSINAYIKNKNKAKSHNKRFETRVFTAHIDKGDKVLGFYALQVGTGRADGIPDKDKTYLRSYSLLPAIHLPYLGVDISIKRQGIGSFLLADVARRAVGVSRNIGFYALTLTALDESAALFYDSLGFIRYHSSKSLEMLMPLPSLVEMVQPESTKPPTHPHAS